MNLMNQMLTNQLGTNIFAAPSVTSNYGGGRPYGGANPFTTPINFYPITLGTPSYNPAVATPTYSSGSSGGNSNFQGYFNSVAALVSQFLGSRGQYQTTQYTPGVGYAPTPAVQIAQAQQQSYGPGGYAPGIGQPGYSPGSALGGGLDGIISWATNNPIYVFLGIAGVYLLFRDPPKGRR